jgi:signal peptidase I
VDSKKGHDFIWSYEMSILEAALTDTRPVRRTVTHAPTPKRFIVRLISTTATTLAAIIASLAIIAAIATHLSPKGQYVMFGHPVMGVLSGSMSPVIRTGDLIVDNPVTATQAEHLQVGQIVSFREAPGSTSIITHRIVAVQVHDGTVSYVTKGDANNAADSPARPSSDVVGIFSSDIPRGAYILSALHRPVVLGSLIASLVLAFLVGPLFRFARQQDEPELSRDEPELSRTRELADTNAR